VLLDSAESHPRITTSLSSVNDMSFRGSDRLAKPATQGYISFLIERVRLVRMRNILTWKSDFFRRVFLD